MNTLTHQENHAVFMAYGKIVSSLEKGDITPEIAQNKLNELNNTAGKKLFYVFSISELIDMQNRAKNKNVEVSEEPSSSSDDDSEY